MLNARRSWCQYLLLTADAVEELAFWLEHINTFNGQNIWPKASAVRVVYSDASSTGFGGYCVEHGDPSGNRMMVKRGGHPEFNMEGAKSSAVGVGHDLPKLKTIGFGGSQTTRMWRE